MTYGFSVYIPPYAQGRLQIRINAPAMASSVTIHLLSADILSAGVNVGSFMAEYALGARYQWRFSSSVAGSSYFDTADLDLGVVTNTGTTGQRGSTQFAWIRSFRCSVDPRIVVEYQ